MPQQGAPSIHDSPSMLAGTDCTKAPARQIVIRRFRGVVYLLPKKMRERTSNIIPPKTTKASRPVAQRSRVRTLLISSAQWVTGGVAGVHTEPQGGDGRLGSLLGPLLELLAGLAAPRLLLLDELEVRASLLGGLRLQSIDRVDLESACLPLLYAHKHTHTRA